MHKHIRRAGPEACAFVVAIVTFVGVFRVLAYDPQPHTGCTDYTVMSNFLDRFAHPPFTPYLYDKRDANATPTPQYLRDHRDDFQRAAEIHHVDPRLAVAISRQEGLCGTVNPNAAPPNNVPSTCELGDNPWGLHDPRDATQTTCRRFLTVRSSINAEMDQLDIYMTFKGCKTIHDIAYLCYKPLDKEGWLNSVEGFYASTLSGDQNYPSNLGGLSLASTLRYQCPCDVYGDCDHDGVTSIEELVLGVRMLNGESPVAACTAYTECACGLSTICPDGRPLCPGGANFSAQVGAVSSSRVTIDRLVRAVNSALGESNEPVCYIPPVANPTPPLPTPDGCDGCRDVVSGSLLCDMCALDFCPACANCGLCPTPTPSPDPCSSCPSSGCVGCPACAQPGCFYCEDNCQPTPVPNTPTPVSTPTPVGRCVFDVFPDGGEQGNTNLHQINLLYCDAFDVAAVALGSYAAQAARAAVRITEANSNFDCSNCELPLQTDESQEKIFFTSGKFTCNTHQTTIHAQIAVFRSDGSQLCTSSPVGIHYVGPPPGELEGACGCLVDVDTGEIQACSCREPGMASLSRVGVDSFAVGRNLYSPGTEYHLQ